MRRRIDGRGALKTINPQGLMALRPISINIFGLCLAQVFGPSL